MIAPNTDTIIANHHAAAFSGELVQRITLAHREHETISNGRALIRLGSWLDQHERAMEVVKPCLLPEMRRIKKAVQNQYDEIEKLVLKDGAAGWSRLIADTAEEMRDIAGMPVNNGDADDPIKVRAALDAAGSTNEGTDSGTV